MSGEMRSPRILVVSWGILGGGQVLTDSGAGLAG